MNFTDWRLWLFTIVIGPLFWAVVTVLVMLLRKEMKAIRKWYYGLPLYQYPAMLIVLLGVRHLQKPYGEWRKMDGRFWFTIKTTGFLVEDDK